MSRLKIPGDHQCHVTMWLCHSCHVILSYALCILKLSIAQPWSVIHSLQLVGVKRYKWLEKTRKGWTWLESSCRSVAFWNQLDPGGWEQKIAERSKGWWLGHIGTQIEDIRPLNLQRLTMFTSASHLDTFPLQLRGSQQDCKHVRGLHCKNQSADARPESDGV